MEFPGDRIATIAGLIPSLTESLTQRIEVFAENIIDEEEKIRILEAIKNRAHEPPSDIVAALEDARNTAEPYWKVQKLLKLTPHLTDSLKGKILRQAFSIAKDDMGNETYGFPGIAALAARPDVQTAVEPAPRYANYELYYTDQYRESSPLGEHDALKEDYQYELQVWIGVKKEGKAIGDERGQRRAIREPGEERNMEIYVMFEPDSAFFDFDVNDRVQIIQLPPASKGDSTSKATFRIRPKQKSSSEKALAEVNVHFYYNFIEIESLKLKAEVVGSDEDPPLSRFGSEKAVYATYGKKLLGWNSLDEIQKREMHITVRSLGDNHYEIIFLYKGVKFKGALRLTREEVEDLILDARNLLEYLAVNPDSPILREQPSRLRESVSKLGNIGRLLWSKMFQSEKNKSLWHIGQFLKEHPLGRDGIIRVDIEDNAAGFVFPWNLLYDHAGLLDANASIENILEGFWGMRYCIEQFYYDSTWNSGPESPVQVDQELQLSFMLLQELPNADLERQFINSLRERSHQRVNVSEPITDATDCFKLLKYCNSHILYFYTRGYTRRRLVDAAVISDLKHGEQGEPEPERSYIELSTKKLYLDELEVNKDAINLCQRPVVLLNMCEGAQITPSLSEGFIPYFLDQQASAVIGTECPMTARFAHPFAVAFFNALLGGDSLGIALLKARREFVRPNQLMAPLGLAYTLYGNATVSYAPPLLVDEAATVNS